MKTPQSPAPVSGRPLTAEDVEIIRDYWSAYADADWHLIPEAIRDDFDARLVAVGLAEWRAVTADDLDDAFAHDRGLEAGGSCLDLTALGYLAFKADADGWMPWSGGENPVPGQRVECRFRDDAGSGLIRSEDMFPHWWRHVQTVAYGHDRDIIAFRLSRPASEQPEADERKAEYRQAIRDFNRMRDDGSLPSEQPVEAIGVERDDLIQRASYMVGNPSAWDSYDDGASEIIRSLVAALSPASPARTPMGEPQVLKGVGKINGDGWKDTTSIGEVVYVWNAEKPSPYAPGQYPRIDNEGWSASTAQYDFSPASVDEVRALAAPTPMGGDREHSSRCWGRTSFSDEVLHCYCQTAPTPMGGEVEALQEEVVKVLGRGFVAQRASIHGGGYYVVGLDGARSGPIFDEDEKATEYLNGIRADAILALHPAAPTDEVGK